MKLNMRKFRVCAAALTLGALASSGVVLTAASAEAATAKTAAVSAKATSAPTVVVRGCRKDCL